MTDDLYLYLQVPGGTPDLVLGRLMIRGFQPETAAGRLKLDLEFFQEDNSRLLSDVNRPPPRWIDLGATVTTNQAVQYTVGTVEIQLYERPAFKPAAPNTRTRVNWLWKLAPEDVERIEAARAPQPAAPVYLTITVNGSVQLHDGVYGFAGSGSLTIATSEWEALLASLGYTLRPSQLGTVGVATRESSAWHDAERRLEQARRHLRAGHDYDALDSCLSELESLVTQPYADQSWKPLVDGMPDQKSSGITRWLGGFATYLNKVGHHKDRSERSPDGDLQLMPLDHWEAELAVAAAHVVLAYALQLRASTQGGL
jgi:hypothetical protein